MTDRDGEDQAFVDAISEWPDVDDGPTLAGFLLARITEDEADARGAARYVGGAFGPYNVGGQAHVVRELWRHANRWHPARVLAECEAKRRIIDFDHHAQDREMSDLFPDDDVAIGPGWCRLDREPWPCDTVKLLALPYADHPDFRDEWRP